MPKAIIIGASRGIGKELAIIFSQHNYELGLVSRNFDMLKQLQSELPGKSHIKAIDISEINQASVQLQSLIDEMGDVDLIIVNAGVLFINSDWEKELETIKINVFGFVAMANVALEYFKKQNKGHLAGVSSVAAYKGGFRSPAYNASKAFVSNYLKGLRKRIKREGKNIIITDIQPGYVATDMIRNNDGKFWVVSPQLAAQQIYTSLVKEKEHIYVPKYWRFIAFLLRLFNI